MNEKAFCEWQQQQLDKDFCLSVIQDLSFSALAVVFGSRRLKDRSAAEPWETSFNEPVQVVWFETVGGGGSVFEIIIIIVAASDTNSVIITGK